MKIEKICEHCKNVFLVKPSDIKFHPCKYCSKGCYTEAKNISVKRLCKYCDKAFKICPSHLARGNGNFCSRNCFFLNRRGSNHPNWTGGRAKTVSGYVTITNRDHPRRNKKTNRVFEHIVVVEEQIGRYVTLEETIHHINEIVDDNRPQNLYLFPSRGEHTRYHQLLKAGKVQPITQSNLEAFHAAGLDNFTQSR